MTTTKKRPEVGTTIKAKDVRKGMTVKLAVPFVHRSGAFATRSGSGVELPTVFTVVEHWTAYTAVNLEARFAGIDGGQKIIHPIDRDELVTVVGYAK